MPNVFMTEGAESIIDRNIDLLADTLTAYLVRTGYVPDADNQFLDEAGANDVVDHWYATGQNLASKVLGKDTTGNFAYLDAADSTFPGVPAGAAYTQVVVAKNTGVNTTSKLISSFDIPDVTPNGGDITIQWATPANGGVLKLQV
jgi:hypothetical protein